MTNNGLSVGYPCDDDKYEKTTFLINKNKKEIFHVLIVVNVIVAIISPKNFPSVW